MQHGDATKCHLLLLVLFFFPRPYTRMIERTFGRCWDRIMRLLYPLSISLLPGFSADNNSFKKREQLKKDENVLKVSLKYRVTKKQGNHLNCSVLISLFAASGWSIRWTSPPPPRAPASSASRGESPASWTPCTDEPLSSPTRRSGRAGSWWQTWSDIQSQFYNHNYLQ